MNTTPPSPSSQSLPTTASTEDFRLYLQGELVRRCKTNPRYSLRAFARLLEVEPSFLSKILNRKRNITEATLDRFGKRLGLAPQQLHGYRQNLTKVQNDANLLKFQQVTMDQFQMISDWYHYAILELITVKGFKPSPKVIARALGIGPNEANDAIERLVRLGYLEIKENGKWMNRTGNNTTIGAEFTTVALRNLQRQVLEMATRALEEVPMELRDQTSMTLAIDTKMLPQAKEKLRKFRREITAFLQKDPAHFDSVYHLGISLYPVTKNLKGELLS